MDEKTNSPSDVQLFYLGEAIGLAKDNGFFPEILNDIQCDPVAVQTLWVEAKGPRSNENKTFSQAGHDAALGYLLREIDGHDDLAARAINKWLRLICGSWPHTKNYFSGAIWKPFFALHLLGGYSRIDQSLYPPASFFGTAFSQNHGTAYLTQFSELNKKTLDLCVAKQILLRTQANVWKKFHEISSKFERSKIDFTSLGKANLALLNPFLFDAMSIVGYISENKHQILDIVSFLDKDMRNKSAGLSNIDFIFYLFANFNGHLKKIDDEFNQIILDSVP
jgi:hypothetical protein